MDKRGVTSIISKIEGKDSILRLYPMGKLIPSFPTWVGCALFDRNESNEKLKHWERIEQDPTYINHIISEMTKKGQIKLRQIDCFRANGNDVDVSQLFPNFTRHYCIFRTKGNSWSLYIVGTKSLEEINAVGLNKKNDSFMPLIICKDQDGFKILNSF